MDWLLPTNHRSHRAWSLASLGRIPIVLLVAITAAGLFHVGNEYESSSYGSGVWTDFRVHADAIGDINATPNLLRGESDVSALAPVKVRTSSAIYPDPVEVQPGLGVVVITYQYTTDTKGSSPIAFGYDEPSTSSGLRVRRTEPRYDAPRLLRVSRVAKATNSIPDATQAAQAEAARIRAGGGKLPTMTTAAVDQTTGKVYLGNSGYKGPVPPEINLPDPSLKPWNAANCGEVAACSAAIADGAKLENLKVSTVYTKNGVVEPPCANCATWVPGKK